MLNIMLHLLLPQKHKGGHEGRQRRKQDTASATSMRLYRLSMYTTPKEGGKRVLSAFYYFIFNNTRAVTLVYTSKKCYLMRQAESQQETARATAALTSGG